VASEEETSELARSLTFLVGEESTEARPNTVNIPRTEIEIVAAARGLLDPFYIKAFETSLITAGLALP
jgi:hypothetical protein